MLDFHSHPRQTVSYLDTGQKGVWCSFSDSSFSMHLRPRVTVNNPIENGFSQHNIS